MDNNYRLLANPHVLVTSVQEQLWQRALLPSAFCWGFNGVRAAAVNCRWLPGTCVSSAVWKMAAIYWDTPGGHLEAKSPSWGVCVTEQQELTHSKPGKRGFTLGKWEINPQKIKKKWWEFLFSSVLVFVLLFTSLYVKWDQIKEICRNSFVFKKEICYFSQFGSDLLGCIQMTIYNCKTFQNLPSSQLDTTSSAETGIYTPKSLEMWDKTF